MTTTINHLDRTRHHAGAMDDTAPPDPEVPERSLGRRQFSAKYKAKVLAEYDTLPRSARGCQRSSNPAVQRDGVQVIQHPGVHVIPHF
jgi:hypothetical protein